MPGATSSQVGAKRSRITRACDRCHDCGIKCAPGPTPGSCRSCLAYGHRCTYDRPVKRRGPAPRSRRPRNPARSSQLIQPSELIASISSPRYEQHAIVEHQTILYLADIYYRVVYPILLYFHWPSFSADLRAKRYLHDRSFYALTMAVCATASARIRTNAPLPPASSNINIDTIPPSESFYKECLDSIPVLVVGAEDFNLMRTEALLGMLALQHNDLGSGHAHLHRYLTMVTQSRFHDERSWPSNLTEIEVEERRRLFWQCYQFDIYLAVTFGSPMRQRAAQCCVRYPAEVYDDGHITESQIRLPDNSAVSFIRGWNFVTDLYRILEHVTEFQRTKEANQTLPGRHLGELFSSMDMSHIKPIRQDVLATMNRLFEELPTELKSARPMTGDVVQDRYGFQATNIMITMTTVKMATTRSEDQDVAERCDIAGELLDGLSAIPTIYVQAGSTAMLHHVAGVGHLLGSVIRFPLSQWRYLQVRSALLAMADLVSSLESALNSAADISSKLREQVQRFDQYMKDTTKGEGTNYVLHSALPTPLVDAPASAPAHETNQRRLQVMDEIAATIAVSHTADLSPGLEPAATQQPGNVPSAGTLDAEASPIFQPPDDAYIDWPIGLDYGGAFEYLADVNDDVILDGASVDDNTQRDNQSS